MIATLLNNRFRNGHMDINEVMRRRQLNGSPTTNMDLVCSRDFEYTQWSNSLHAIEE